MTLRCSSNAQLNPEKPLHTQHEPLSERLNLIKWVMCSGSPHLHASCSSSQNLPPLLVLLILLGPTYDYFSQEASSDGSDPQLTSDI